MRLVELCEPLFQYACRLNRSARKGVELSAEAVRADVKQILFDMRTRAMQEPSLASQYDAVEPALIYFIDQIIEQSDLPYAADWSRSRLQRELKQRNDGDEHFFDLLDEALADKSDEAAERLAVFYTCLGLGFRGFYAGNPEFLRRKMAETSARLRHTMDTEPGATIVPDAYEHVDQSDLVQPPGRSLLGLLVVLVVSALVVAAGNAIVYYTNSADLARALDVVRQAEPGSLFDEAQGPTAGDGDRARGSREGQGAG